MYNDPNAKPWTSRRWAPEGYASRQEAVQVEKEKALAHAAGEDLDADNAAAPQPGVGEVMNDGSTTVGEKKTASSATA